MDLIRIFSIAAVACLPLSAADYPQLLAEFQKTKPEVTAVHVIAETPLLVAVTGPQGSRQSPSSWGTGQLLGVFAHRGNGIVPVTVVPAEADGAVWIEHQTADSITFAVADPDYGIRS